MRLFLGLLAIAGTVVAVGLVLVLRDRGSEPILLPQDAMPGRLLFGRDPVLPVSAEVARVPALELAYYVPAGTPVDVTVDGQREPSVPLEQDGWVEVPLDGQTRDELNVRVADPHGHTVTRTLQLREPEAFSSRART
jgi:hypothetical protein